MNPASKRPLPRNEASGVRASTHGRGSERQDESRLCPDDMVVFQQSLLRKTVDLASHQSELEVEEVVV